MKRICIVGASGKLGRYMIRRALENDKLVHEAPATVGRLAESAVTFAAVKESL